jgi:hypothetical protein
VCTDCAGSAGSQLPPAWVLLLNAFPFGWFQPWAKPRTTMTICGHNRGQVRAVPKS